MESSQFKFEIGATVQIGTGGLKGRVTGRAQYENSSDSYLVQYTDKVSDLPKTDWFDVSVIS